MKRQIFLWTAKRARIRLVASVRWSDSVSDLASICRRYKLRVVDGGKPGTANSPMKHKSGTLLKNCCVCNLLLFWQVGRLRSIILLMAICDYPGSYLDYHSIRCTVHTGLPADIDNLKENRKSSKRYTRVGGTYPAVQLARRHYPSNAPKTSYKEATGICPLYHSLPLPRL